MNKKHSDLEIAMEMICTSSPGIKNLAYNELRSRKLGALKISFLKTVCKTALVSMSFFRLEYESYMYEEKEIKRAFWRFFPFSLFMAGVMLFLMFKLALNALITTFSGADVSGQPKLSGEFSTSDRISSFQKH